MRGTKASDARRSIKSPDSAAPARDNMNISSFAITVNRIRHRYHDGELVRDNSFTPTYLYDRPSYMNSTLSSAYRHWQGKTEAHRKVKALADNKRAERQALRAARTADTPEFEDVNVAWEVELEDWGRRTPIEEPPLVSPNENPPTHPNWIDDEPQLVNCFSDVPKAYQFACFALQLGRESLWHYTDEHHKEFCSNLSLHGPIMVAACFRELEDASNDWRFARELGILQELQDFSNLRNFVCHPNGRIQDLARYDLEAERAERLMGKLGDEARLRKLWEARDGLRVEAVTMLAEIEEREAIAELLGGYVEDGGVWEEKHVKLFRWLLRWNEQDRRNPDYLYPVVCRVAERWGEMNP